MKNYALMAGIPLLVLALLLILYVFPPHLVTQQQRTITVTGSAQSQKNNEVAQFTAGVSAVNDDKQKAVSEVNTKTAELIKAVKAFGIAPKDIRTQNLNIYQGQEMYYDGGTQKQRMGQWNVSNSVEMTLRDVNRASEFADLLSQSGANNVFGPNFSIDRKSGNDEALMKAAVADATAKAKSIGAGSGMTVGKVITVQEVAEQIAMPFSAKGLGGGGGAPTEPGSTAVTKSVIVTFELK